MDDPEIKQRCFRKVKHIFEVEVRLWNGRSLSKKRHKRVFDTILLILILTHIIKNSGSCGDKLGSLMLHMKPSWNMLFSHVINRKIPSTLIERIFSHVSRKMICL